MEEPIVRHAFATHSASLHRYASRITGDPDLAEDLVQDAFIRFSREPEVANHKAWLFRVTTNLAFNARRSIGRRLGLLRRGFHRQPMGDAIPPPDERYQQEEIRALVREALDRLSDRDRTLLLMREEGFTHGEIADAVGSTTKSIGTLLARALTKVAAHLEDVQEALI